MRSVSSADVESVSASPSGEFVVTDYIGSFRGVSLEHQQAFLVEQNAAELRAHFHEVDQFQVFVAGSGRVGHDEVASGTVHYADAYTAYGPIRASADSGVAYFTLRLSETVGANFMPESRHKRAAAAGRGSHFTCRVQPNPDSLSLASPVVLLAETPRGARAYGCWLPAGAGLASDAVATVTGRGYAVVISGSSMVSVDRCPSDR